MTVLKINIANRDSAYTKFRLYRSADKATVYNEENFLKEVDAADFITDDITAVGLTVKEFFYGLRQLTAAGGSVDAAPFRVENKYSLDYLHCSHLTSPFKEGDATFGIYHDDVSFAAMPTQAEGAAFIRAKLTTDYPAAAAGPQFIYTHKGRIFTGGHTYVWSSGITHGAMRNNIPTLFNALEAVPEVDRVLVKNGFKWRLCFPPVEALVDMGAFMVAGGPMICNKYVAPTHQLHTYDEVVPEAAYLQSISGVTGKYGKYTTSINVSTSYPSIIGLYFEFIGRE